MIYVINIKLFVTFLLRNKGKSMIRLDRRGLSPVIGAIILIAVTVAVSVVVASWLGGITLGFMSNAEQATITNVNFNNSTAVTVSVRNAGSSTVSISSAAIDGNTATMTPVAFSIDKGSVAFLVLTGTTFNNGEKYSIKLLTAKGNTVLFVVEANLPVILNPVDDGWHYSKSHVINSQSGAGIGYQIRIMVHFGSGTDSGENVYLNGKCQADFDDIRFTSSDGTTLLDYWLESSTTEEAVFWVRLTDNLDVSSSTIYIIYGNNAVGSLSNGHNTFPALFTDFDGDSLPEGWQVDSNTFGTISVEDSLLKLTGDPSSSGSWKYLGVKTSSPVWGNDQALMYRIDSINYYPNNNRHLWYLRRRSN